jgi:hypothetical protein
MNGFSKYDGNGNVIYSQGVGSLGEVVHHFYSYDNFGRRISYKKQDSVNLFEEKTAYNDDGSKIIRSYDIPSYTFYKRLYNRNGRMIEETIIDHNGNIVHKVYDPYNDKYNVYRTREPFCISIT